MQSTTSSKKGFSYPTMVLLTVTSIALLVNYVETMVIPGIPTIQKDFGTTEEVAAWITSAFLIVGSASAPLFGKMGDMYGKRKILLVVLVFYVVGVGIAAISTSIYMLLFARALQGIGFSIVPLAIAIITDVFPREKVAGAQGIISGTFAIGATAGLVVGAYIVEDFGWRYAFASALVLSILLIVIVFKVLRKDAPGQQRKMDYNGTFLLMAGVTLSLLYLTEGPTLGWTDPMNLMFLIVGLVLVIAFFIYENRQRDPLIPLALLRIRNVLLSNLIGIISGIVMFLVFFAVIYYAQLPKPYGLGLDVIQTGLVAAPATILMLVAGPLAGRVVGRSGPKPVLIFGSVLLITGLTMFLLNRSSSFMVTVDTSVTLVGMVCLIIPIINMIAVTLPPENIAVGLGISTMLRNLGGAIGPVVATTLMATYTISLIVNIGGNDMVVGTVPSSTAFDAIFIIGIVLMMAVIIMSLMVKNYTCANGVCEPTKKNGPRGPNGPS